MHFGLLVSFSMVKRKKVISLVPLKIYSDSSLFDVLWAVWERIIPRFQEAGENCKLKASHLCFPVLCGCGTRPGMFPLELPLVLAILNVVSHSSQFTFCLPTVMIASAISEKLYSIFLMHLLKQ